MTTGTPVAVTRRLAAILAADVVGYSTLMDADGAGTLDALRRLRSEVFGPVVAACRGKLVKSMGDGWLAAFHSAQDAAACAMQVQDRLAAHETIRLRVGVHVGDVTLEAEDVFGDGVNVAARLEALAEPGVVLISDMVYASMDGMLRPSFDDAGEHTLKNIPRPIRVWRRAAAQAASLVRPAASGEGWPRLTIRPVLTSDTRAELRDLAMALTGDLSAFLGAIRWLAVGTAETGADDGYVLQTALRSRGDRLRLEARLTHGGAPVWTGKYDGDLGDLFDWQDETGEAVAATASRVILDEEMARLAAVPTEAMTAADCLLSGCMVRRDFGRQSFVDAITLFSRAVARDPTLAQAYAEGVFAIIALRTVGYAGVAEQFDTDYAAWRAAARGLVERTPLLDLSLALADFMDGGPIAVLRATLADLLRRAPFDPEISAYTGWSYIWSGDPAAALTCFARFRRIGRFGPARIAALGGAAVASVMTGDDEAAIAFAREGLDLAATYPTLHATLAAALALSGLQTEAEAAMAGYRRVNPDRTLSSWMARNNYAGCAGGQRYFDGLRKAGLPA